jgi:hypothetical protein
MKVFATKFLEPLSSESVKEVDKWIWEPHNKKIAGIYASGAKTGTHASTYASEKDNMSDTDRPGEGS